MNAFTEHEQKVWAVKQNVRKLNPLHRVRYTDPWHDGSNNPNVPRQDNGLNAWMDTNLNGEELDELIKFDTNYAKKTSDNSKFYDVDYIPIHRLPKRLIFHRTSHSNMPQLLPICS